MKKTTPVKKTFKPVYTVDMRDCETANDLLAAFGEAKQKAKLPITDDELNAIIDKNSVLIIVETEAVCVCQEKPKKNIFKRFWDWLRRK